MCFSPTSSFVGCLLAQAWTGLANFLADLAQRHKRLEHGLGNVHIVRCIVLKHSKERGNSLLADIGLPITAEALESKDGGSSVVDLRTGLYLLDELADCVCCRLRGSTELPSQCCHG